MAPKATLKRPPKAAPKAPPPPVINPGLVPALAGQDSQPADATLYLTIDLNISGQQAKTAVYIPKKAGLGTGGAVNVILYLHGHKTINQFPELKGKVLDIEELFKLPRPAKQKKGTHYYAIREEIAQTVRTNFVFTAPTLGNTSQGGILINSKDGTGDPLGYLQAVMRGLKQHLTLTTEPKPGNLILAGHSGGGVPMRLLAQHPAIRGMVREAWCFDSLYGGKTDIYFWTKWAVGQPQHRLFIHSTGTTWEKIDKTKPLSSDNRHCWGGTCSASNTIKDYTSKHKNIQVEMQTRTSDHHLSPVVWIKDLIDRSTALT